MKNYLLFGGLALAGFTLFGKKKLTGISQVAQQLEVKVKGIKNLKVTFSAIHFNVSIELFNPTDQDLTVHTGKMLTLRSIRFYDQSGKFIGESFPNLNNIEIPAKSGINLTSIPTTINLKNIDAAFNSLVNNALNQQAMKYEMNFEAFGKNFIVNA